MYLKRSARLAEANEVLAPIIEQIDGAIFKNKTPTFIVETLAALSGKSPEQVDSVLRLFCKDGLLRPVQVARCASDECSALNELEGGKARASCSDCGSDSFEKEMETVYRLSVEGSAEKKNVLAGFDTDNWPRDVASYRGKVDAVVVSIKQEEFEAVVPLFKVDRTTVGGRREWNMCRVWSEKAQRNFRVAIVRTNDQGNTESYAITRDAIQDLEPTCVLVVGIAGAVPGDLTLGDVVFGNYVHNLNLQDVKDGGKRSFSLKGGEIAPGAKNALSNLPISIPDYLRGLEFSQLPPLDPSAEIKGDDDTAKKIRARLQERYGDEPKRPPIQFYRDGEIASSDTLVRYVELIDQWKTMIKHILCVDMESAGACKAANAEGKGTAVIPIRAMSDVIGLQRDDKWLLYACEVAAKVARAFIESWEVVPGTKS